VGLKEGLDVGFDTEGPAVRLDDGPAVRLDDGPAVRLDDGPAVRLDDGTVVGAIVDELRYANHCNLDLSP